MPIYRGSGGSGNSTSGGNANQVAQDAVKACQCAVDACKCAEEADQSAQDALSSWLEFNALYLGAKSSEPSTDNQGNPLQVGATYYDTTTESFMVWSGSSWGSGSGITLPDEYDDTQIKADLAAETQARIDGDAALQTQITNHNHDGAYQPVGDYIEDANSDGKQYARQDGAWSEVVIPEGGTGSSVHIGKDAPTDVQEGQQWMEVPDDGEATMWIYDGAKWLEQPSGSSGADSLWTDNGDSISYSAGNVGIGTDEISGLSGKPTVHINDKAGNGAIRVGNVTGSGGNVFIDHSDASGARLRANESPLSIGTNGSEDIRFHTDGEEKTRLTIDSTGDATFSGTVNAQKVVLNGNGGITCNRDKFILPVNASGTEEDATISLGRGAGGGFAEYKFKDAFFSGTVNANGFVGDGSALTGMYSGADAVKTSGAQTISGIKTFNSDIRCKANVYAYYGSDERLKDEIAPMPLGLIDDIDPSTWKWKEDGRSSGGVIAQQLQQIGLDDWVRESPEGDLGVDYNALIGMLIAEVKDLKRQINEK